MTALYLDQRGCRLSADGVSLCLRLPDDRLQWVPIAQLSRVVVACDMDLSAAALRKLADARVPLTILRGRSRADASMLWPQSGDAQRRLCQRRAFDDATISVRLARWLVRRRIAGQLSLLWQARQARPDLRLALTRPARLLTAQLQRLAMHADCAALRGAEGSAARLFFLGYGRLFAPSWGFRGRRRRPPTDPVNALLSLGYSLLHARVLDEVHLAGLDASLGCCTSHCGTVPAWPVTWSSPSGSPSSGWYGSCCANRSGTLRTSATTATAYAWLKAVMAHSLLRLSRCCAQPRYAHDAD